MNLFREYLISTAQRICDFIESLGRKPTESEKRKLQIRRWEEREARLRRNNNSQMTKRGKMIYRRIMMGCCLLIGLVVLFLGILIKQSMNQKSDTRRILASIEDALSTGDVVTAKTRIYRSLRESPNLKLDSNTRFNQYWKDVIFKSIENAIISGEGDKAERIIYVTLNKYSHLNITEDKLFVELQDKIMELHHVKNEEDAITTAERSLASGDLDGALRTYKAFIQNFPLSSKVADVTEKLPKIEQQIETQAREVAARTKLEEQERYRRELEQRIRTGVLSVEEWSRLLRGKTMIQVRELIGAPDSTWDSDAQWVYYRRILHPVTEKPDALYINFHGTGVVNTFSASASGTKWTP